MNGEDIWLEKAYKSLLQNDFGYAVSCLHISAELQPRDKVQEIHFMAMALQELQSLQKTSTVPGSPGRLIVNKIIFILADNAIERKDYSNAKRMLKDAEGTSPKADKMMKKVIQLEECQEKAYVLYQKAVQAYRKRHLGTAKRLLETALKVHPNDNIKRFLQQIHQEIEIGRPRNTRNNYNLPAFLTVLFNFLTCGLCSCCNGYNRLNNEENIHDETSNPRNRNSNYNFSRNNIPHARVQINPQASRTNRGYDNNHRVPPNNTPGNRNDRKPTPYAFSGNNMSNTRVRIERNNINGDRRSNSNESHRNDNNKGHRNNDRNRNDNYRNKNNNDRKTNNKGNNSHNVKKGPTAAQLEAVNKVLRATNDYERLDYRRGKRKTDKKTKTMNIV